MNAELRSSARARAGVRLGATRNVDRLCRVTTAARPRRRAELFHALSDETRLAVIEMLQSGERCVCELQDELDAAQSRLSFHLRVLKDAGLVHDRKDGRWVHYSLNPEAFAELREVVADLRPTRRALPTKSVVCCD